MRGRLLFANRLTDENVEEVTAHLDSVLAGQTFTVVTVNEYFGHRPEVRIGMKLRSEHVTFKRYDGYAAIDLTDDDYVTALHTNDRRGTDLAIYEREILAELYAPAGHHLWWSWTVEGER